MVALERALAATLSRRRMLAVGVGLAYSGLLTACGLGRTGSNPVSPSATTTASTVPVSTPACVVTPQETEGPYFVDERLHRSDIRTDPSDGSTRPGLPLMLTFTVARHGSPCAALAGAQVDVWHCDALGVYSDVGAENSSGRQFLRGYQLTDANGKVTFTTIYPGWYRGRTAHIHFKVRTFSGSQKTFEFTSQIFFADAISDEVYKQAPYSSRGARDTRNAGDMVFTSNDNSGSKLLATLTRTGSGYDAGFAIGLTSV